VVRVVSLLTGIPYSFSAHASDIWHDKLLLREKVHEARFVSCCNCCGQDELRREALAQDREKVHLIYHGIDIRRFKPPEGGVRNPRLVLSVGRFDPVKGFPVLIEACRLLREQGVPFECRMVGDGDEFAKVKDLVTRHKLESHVHLLGGLPQDQIIRHYQEASVFVLPCIEGDDGRHDGLPNVVLEAMACGVPVVSTPIGAVREAVEDNVNGILCKPNSAEHLAEAIRRVLTQEDLRTRLGRNARECVTTRFDSQASIEPLIRLFQSHCGLRHPEIECRERMPA
jgi:glycosyltransferase involved in cell wall biosynthesis